MNRGGVRTAIVPLVLCCGSCVPWTVRPIAETEQSRGGSSVAATADPVAYVESIWQSKLLPGVEKAAVDVAVLLDALRASPTGAQARYGLRRDSGPVYFAVQGTGRVVSVNTGSKVGLAMVDVAPLDGRADLSIQIGPVIRGTSLRDATGAVRFSDFVNQLQFADAGNELNNRVLNTVLAPVRERLRSGVTISFAGTLAAVQPGSGAQVAGVPLAELVPIHLAVVEEGRR